MATAAKFVLLIPIFLAYLVALDVDVTGNITHMNLSTADLRNYWTEFHETWWSYRYMFLVGPNVSSFKGGQSHILRGSKWVGVTIESYGKVEISFLRYCGGHFENDD
jgi:hypothetical protein